MLRINSYLLTAFVLLATQIVVAQKATTELQIFDISVQYFGDAQNSLEVSWYPDKKFTEFHLHYTDLSTGVKLSIKRDNVTTTILEGIQPGRDYSIYVEAVDESWEVVARSSTEMFYSDRTTSAEHLQAFSQRGKSSRVPTLGAILNSLDSNNFPFIFSHVSVDTGGQPVGGLKKNNFTVFEDGVLQTDFFDVTPPGSGGGVRILDFVFLIDNSGSMQDEQQQVKDNVRDFVDSLAARQIDVRLGLVRFGQTAGGGQPILTNNAILTGDINFFKTLLNQMTFDGGFEPGIDAVFQAATLYSFRPGSQRHFLLITDEDSDGGNLSQTVNTCQANSITVHTAVDCSFGSSLSHYCSTGSIRQATGGFLFDVVGPYRDILDVLQGLIGNTYVVSYRTSNSALNGVQREVRISIGAFSQSTQVIGYYTPGAAPLIVRTQPTIDLSGSAQLAGTTLKIEAAITDAAAPFVQNARLYYRVTGNNTYASLVMTNIGNNIYQAFIPASGVQTPGIDYYITATDGQVTSSAPTVDPANLPYQIAVLPNQPPVISHTPIAQGSIGQSITINATATDNTNTITGVELWYRQVGTLLFSKQVMTTTGSNRYMGVIPGNAMTSFGVEYLIRATDDFGLTSIHGIHLIGAGGTSTIFTRILSGSIVNDSRSSAGCAWADIDNDADDDLFITDRVFTQRNYLYLNNGDGSFARVTSGRIVTDTDESFGCSWADYNNDGFVDMFVANKKRSNFLYQNNGNGTFTKISSNPVVTAVGDSRGASWGDYDADGYVDLFIANTDGENNSLFRNNGNGAFLKIQNSVLTTDGAVSTHVSWCDYDNDGSLDVFVTNWKENNALYHNNGNGTFTQTTTGAIVNDLGASFGGSWGDYDNDGYFDLFVTNDPDDNFLYRNNGNGTFAKVTSGAIVSDGKMSFGSSWGDYDNDGDLDLVVANKGQNNLLFENKGNSTFAKVVNERVVTDGGTSYGCTWNDYDKDGDLDLFVVNQKEADFLYENNGNNNNWVNIKCIGTSSNKSGIGAVVKLTTIISGNTSTQVRHISGQSGGGYAGQNSLSAHFGLGDATQIDQIEINWPSGIQQILNNISVNQFLTVVEKSVSADILPVVASQQTSGTEFWVDIAVNSVQNLFGLSFQLIYSNTQYIDVVLPTSNSVIPGPFIGNDVVFSSNVDEASTKVSIGVSRKAGQGGVSGSGVIARIKFVSKTTTPSGTQVLFSLSDVVANTPSGQSISLTPGDATTEITGILVWPGDTNNDGLVNQVDVLPIGLYWNLTGSARPNASSFWVGQAVAPWGTLAATYADANGNGRVDQADVLPIGLNWNQTHSNTVSLKKRSFMAKAMDTSAQLSTDYSSQIDKVSAESLNFIVTGEANPGEDFFIDVFANDVNNLFGLAFELTWSPNTFIELLSVEAGAVNLLGDDFLFLPSIDNANSTASLGISRKAGQGGVNGSGLVTRILAHMSSSAVAGQDSTQLMLQNIQANDPMGSVIPFETSQATIVTDIYGLTAGSELGTFLLHQNYPNPFNPGTEISYQIPQGTFVRLYVFDILGRRVRTLVDEVQQPGSHLVIWDTLDDQEQSVASGVYIYQLNAGNFSQVGKMLLLR